MCSDPTNGYGCDNCSGGGVVTGSRGTVKRIAYAADPSQCCISGQKIIDGKTCDPKYRDRSTTTCDIPMRNYCSNNNWSKPECIAWVNAAIAKNRTDANQAIGDYCGKGQNFKTTECQNWCGLVKKNSTMSTACDGAVLAYCGANTSDPLCACLQPPSNVTKIQDLMSSSKACWYKPCQTLNNDNYITSSLADDKKNCVSTTCLIEAGDINISGTDNAVTFNNQCATNILKPQTTSKPSPSPSHSPPQPANSTPKNSLPKSNNVPTKPNKSSSNTIKENIVKNKYVIAVGAGLGISSSLMCCCVILVIIIMVMMSSN
jgi:Pox virus entry-fusion-complex G9/A16